MMPGADAPGDGTPGAVPMSSSPLLAVVAWLRARAIRWFDRPPTVRAAFLPFLLLSAILYCRLPTTNYIFDEQEALLANPYVNAVEGLRYRDAIRRDFWLSLIHI